ncbi:MAG: type II toxin-antitoxin system VapC family toxin [Acidobacteriia bacterium]|nr:type II toxin-antitoxin system VapC family toxin [Terriglobia bacterium]
MERAEITYLDTHVLVRLYLGETRGIGPTALHAIENGELLVSPAAILELELLHEIGRLRQPALKVVAALKEDLELRICDLPFWATAERALGEGWVRDPFDRLIVANAKARNAPLVTKDEQILRHYSRAIWE